VIQFFFYYSNFKRIVYCIYNYFKIIWERSNVIFFYNTTINTFKILKNLLLYKFTTKYQVKNCFHTINSNTKNIRCFQKCDLIVSLNYIPYTFSKTLTFKLFEIMSIFSWIIIIGCNYIISDSSAGKSCENQRNLRVYNIIIIHVVGCMYACSKQLN
jgi:hypothetical protein